MPKRKSAFDAATTNRRSYTQVMKEAQQDGETVEQSKGEVVEPLHGETVTQQHSDTVEQLKSEAVKLLEGEATTQQSSETVELYYGETSERLYNNTVTQQDSSTVTLSHRQTVKKEAKISFYFTAEQEKKLDTLELEYRLRTGRRINRNDIMRYLLDHCTIEGLIAGMGEPTA